MSLTDYKIEPGDYIGQDIMGLPDQVVGDAAALKARFDALVKQVLAPKINGLIDALHPVGEIYLSADNVNPAEKFGGTWVPWGSGRVPVGVDGAQTEFETAEKTGGAKVHTLTIGQMPSHNHTFSDLPSNEEGGAWAGAKGVSEVRSASSSYAGNGQPHNNLQPYITCYMWKRTA